MCVSYTAKELLRNLTSHDSMADTGFPERYTATSEMLNITAPDLFNKYTTAQNINNSIILQKTDLQAKVMQLHAQLENVKKSADTYDREFLDRSAKPKRGFFNSRGLSTLQDWLFFTFFLSYLIISLTIFSFVVSTAIPQYKMTYGFLVLIMTFIIGVMLSALIMRYV